MDRVITICKSKLYNKEKGIEIKDIYSVTGEDDITRIVNLEQLIEIIKNLEEANYE